VWNPVGVRLLASPCGVSGACLAVDAAESENAEAHEYERNRQTGKHVNHSVGLEV